ncbi:hypothetical protein ACU5AX_20115 [Sphingomonas sp. XXL09]|uniref:hypothetical protein n=1 Tax=Sphingomonas sp. XXL09 TaxID=3457787 RepID=UPI00406BBE7A
MDISNLGIVALAVIAAGGALFAFRYNKSKSRADTNRVTIRDVTTNGDVAGRDIHKRK